MRHCDELARQAGLVEHLLDVGPPAPGTDQAREIAVGLAELKPDTVHRPRKLLVTRARRPHGEHTGLVGAQAAALTPRELLEDGFVLVGRAVPDAAALAR